jgi:hypothetical protein
MNTNIFWTEFVILSPDIEEKLDYLRDKRFLGGDPLWDRFFYRI